MPVKKPPTAASLRAGANSSRLPQPVSRAQPKMTKKSTTESTIDSSDDEEPERPNNNNTPPPKNNTSDGKPSISSTRPVRQVRQQQQQYSDPHHQQLPTTSNNFTRIIQASPSSEKFTPANVILLPSKIMDELQLVVGSLVEVYHHQHHGGCNNNNNVVIILSVIRDTEQDRLRKSSSSSALMTARMKASTLLSIIMTNDDNDSNEDNDDDDTQMMSSAGGGNVNNNKIGIRVYTKCDLDDLEQISIRIRGNDDGDEQEQHQDTNHNSNNTNKKSNNSNNYFSVLEQLEMFERSLPRDSGAASIVFKGMIVQSSTRGSRMVDFEVINCTAAVKKDIRGSSSSVVGSNGCFVNGTKLKVVESVPRPSSSSSSSVIPSTTSTKKDERTEGDKNNNNNKHNNNRSLIHFIVGDAGYGKTTMMKKIFDDENADHTTSCSASKKWIAGGGIAALSSTKEKVQFLHSLSSSSSSCYLDAIFFDDVHLFLSSDELVVVAFCDMLKKLLLRPTTNVEIFCSVSSSSSSHKSRIEDILPKEIFSAVVCGTYCKHEIEYLTLPSTEERIEIMRSMICTTNNNNNNNSDCSSIRINASNESIDDIASTAYGYSPLDFKVLLDVAKSQAMMTTPTSLITTITETDLRRARRLVQPASLKSINAVAPPPSLSWDDIGGSDEAKNSLQECLAFANEKAQRQFSKFGVSAPRGVLLYGPPGNSKTMLAKCVASAGKMNFISVKGPEVFSKWVGDSEKAVRDIFERARSAAPCVVFVDEIDGMCGKRGGGGVGDRVIAQLLTELDGLPKETTTTISSSSVNTNTNTNNNKSSNNSSSSSSSGIVFIAATNRPDVLDAALLRPGRIDRKIYVGLPSADDRKKIVRIALRGIPLSKEIEDDNFLEKDLASDAMTQGYTGAEMVSLCKRAAALAVYEDANCNFVEKKHFAQAKKEVQPRVQKKDLEWYLNWGKK